MGRKQIELVVHAYLSNHNDDQDQADQQLWEQFVRAVRDLAERHEYDPINLSVSE